MKNMCPTSIQITLKMHLKSKNMSDTMKNLTIISIITYITAILLFSFVIFKINKNLYQNKYTGIHKSIQERGTLYLNQDTILIQEICPIDEEYNTYQCINLATGKEMEFEAKWTFGGNENDTIFIILARIPHS